MNYAGISRPASGVEHYISHILDMRGISFGTLVSLHGIQCAVGTRIAADLYEKITKITPDKQKALAYAQQFDFSTWCDVLSSFLGTGAEPMIAQEAKEKKYDLISHAGRLERILSYWDEILRIIHEEVPRKSDLERLYTEVNLPCSLSQLGIDDTILPTIFKATKDIRDKYVLSRLAWDLGVLDEII